jgi:hypothetical protein
MRTAGLLIALAACCPDGPSVTGSGTRQATLDQAFHADPRWLGGDGAYTIDLRDGRVLWLFGDSFIATSDARVRTESTMVRNSVAVMDGLDLATAPMTFAWREGSPPTSFFPEAGDHWFWPADGARIDNAPLLVFLGEVRATPNEGLGFASAGYRAVRVADPSGAPASWTLEPVATVPAPHDPTASIACSTVDDGYLVALVSDTDAHHLRLARWPLDAVAAGDLSEPWWWVDDQWTPQSALAHPPSIVIDDGSSECSLHRQGRTWIYVASQGFGASTIIVRDALAVTGPWEDPVTVFTPPESSAPDAFVYAGKGHPVVVSPGMGLVVTYADNSFTFGDLFDPARAATLYWPHVAEIVLGWLAC